MCSLLPGRSTSSLTEQFHFCPVRGNARITDTLQIHSVYSCRILDILDHCLITDVIWHSSYFVSNEKYDKIIEFAVSKHSALLRKISEIILVVYSFLNILSTDLIKPIQWKANDKEIVRNLLIYRRNTESITCFWKVQKRSTEEQWG